jgi:hypothetical protein
MNTTRWLAVTIATLTLACGSSTAKQDGTGGSGGTSGAGGTSGSGGASGSGGTSGSGAAGGSAGTGGSMGTADAAAEAGASNGGSDAAMDTAGGGASMMITASAGGTVAVGAASLLIPAGALGADVTITASMRAPGAGDPGAANISGNIYEFGPSGTTFLRPAILALALPMAPPATKEAVVAWLDVASGQWFPVPSTASGTKVSGSVSHFTSFAILLIDKGISCPFGGACGGALEGTWKYSAACIKGPPGSPIKCNQDGTVVAPVQTEFGLEGTVTIGGGRFNASQMITGRTTIYYSPECFAAVKGVAGDPMDCPGLQKFLNMNMNANWVCAGTVAQGCSCSNTQMLAQMPMGAVVVTGQQVAFNEDGKAPDMPGDYCVKGNTLTVKDSDGTVFTAVKQ